MITKKINIDDLDIYYRDEGIRSKPTLLWLDGLSISKDLNGRLHKTGRFLSSFENDFHIISLEYPAFMRSSIPQTEWKIEDYIALIHKFIHSTVIKRPILLMGHSMGAMFSFAYTSIYPEDVKLLVISAPPASYKYSPSKTKIFYLLEKLLVFILDSKFIPSKFKKLIPKYFMSTSSENLSKYSISQFKTAIMSYVHMTTSDYFHLASKIKSPTILISGNHDYLVPAENLDMIKNEIKNCSYYKFNEGHTTLPWRIVELKSKIINEMSN